MYHGRLTPDVELIGIHIHARSAQVAEQRKRLINGWHNMQVYILNNAAIIGIEVLILPLEFGIGGPFFIIPVVISSYRQYIFFMAEFDQVSNIKSKSRHPIFMR